MASLAGTEQEVAIDLDQAWVTSLRSRVLLPSPPNQRRIEPPTIFKVPAIMREPDPQAYDPKLISLGPLHRHNPQLQPMNHLKLRYLRRILRRNPDAELEDYLKLIKSLEPQSRSCYSTHIDMASNDFVELLLLDGCFIVQLLLMQYDGDDDGESKEEEEEEEEEDDPIQTTAWTLPLIEYDLLMLENQIPFFVLEKIFDLATGAQDSTTRSIVEHVLAFFEDHGVALPPEEDEEAAPKIHHILHLFHCAIMPDRCETKPYRPTIYNKLDRATRVSARWLYRRVLSSFRINRPKRRRVDEEETAERSAPPTPESVPSATRLKESGVKFRPKNDAKSFLDVTFDSGAMCFPTLHVYDQTNSLFRNLIAFEQCFPRSGTHVAAYAVLMDCLIDTAEDVALLHRYECIMNGLGNDDDAAVLFNRLCKEVAVDYGACYLARLFKDVNKHCESRWNKWRAKLMHDYFSTPWAFLSLVGALVIIYLTVVQTVFTVISYFWQKNHS